MENINIKIIHPTNNSDIDIGIPEGMLIRDIFTQLIEAEFLSLGPRYFGIIMSSDMREDSISLDNDKSILANGVKDNETIQTIIPHELCFHCHLGFLTSQMLSLCHEYREHVVTANTHNINSAITNQIAQLCINFLSTKMAYDARQSGKPSFTNDGNSIQNIYNEKIYTVYTEVAKPMIHINAAPGICPFCEISMSFIEGRTHHTCAKCGYKIFNTSIWGKRKTN